MTAQIEIPVPQRRSGGRAGILYLALADNEAESHVARGENAGRWRTWPWCVLSPKSERSVLESSFTKDVTLSASGAGTNGLRVVAFLQDPDSGHILGAVVTAQNAACIRGRL